MLQNYGMLTTTMHTSGVSTHVVTMYMYKLHACVVAHLGHVPACAGGNDYTWPHSP